MFGFFYEGGLKVEGMLLLSGRGRGGDFGEWGEMGGCVLWYLVEELMILRNFWELRENR